MCVILVYCISACLTDVILRGACALRLWITLPSVSANMVRSSPE